MMGRYTTEMITDEDAVRLIETFRHGYSHNGITHRPNPKMVAILQLENNLGVRLSDILNLRTTSFKKEHGTWVIDIVEIKTKKKRHFVVPSQLKSYIDGYCLEHGIIDGKLFDITEKAVWKQLRLATDYLGLEKISTHSFRKAAAFRVYENSGKDIALTCQYLQHSSPAITMSYLRRTSKQLEDTLSNTIKLY